MDAITTVPIVNVQPSFPSVLQDVFDARVPYEDVWVSCYHHHHHHPQSSKSGQQSVHAKIQAILDESNRDQINLMTKESDDVHISKDNNNNNKYSFEVECKSLGIPKTLVVTPVQEYSDPDTANPRQPQGITAFDVSPDETQYAVGHLDGSVYIYPTAPVDNHPSYTAQSITGNIKQRSKPHLSGVSSLQFFPSSSRLLLTAGLDFTLTLLPTDSPNEQHPAQQRLAPVRTMRSHTRPITSVGIVAPEGKNVISSSLDSTVKIWDVPTGAVASTIVATGPVLSMALGERLAGGVDGVDTRDVVMDEDEEEEAASTTARPPRVYPETGAHIAVCGLQNGSVQVLDLRTRTSTYRSAPSSYGGISAIAYSPTRNLCATGSNRGIVSVYDVRTFGSSPDPAPRPLLVFRRNEASVEDLAFGEGAKNLAIATSDGLPYVAAVSDGNVKVAAELVGVDCDSVRRVKVGNGSVWCASGDAVVRRYSLC